MNISPLACYLIVYYNTTMIRIFFDDNRREGSHKKHVFSHIFPFARVMCSPARATCWSLAWNLLYADLKHSTLAAHRELLLCVLLVTHATMDRGI